MKLKSRKLFVFVVATALVCFKVITSPAWVTIACFYIGGNVAQKYLLRKKEEE